MALSVGVSNEETETAFVQFATGRQVGSSERGWPRLLLSRLSSMVPSRESATDPIPPSGTALFGICA